MTSTTATRPPHSNATGWHDVKVISQRLGHANIGITLDTYSHVLPAADEHAAKTHPRDRCRLGSVTRTGSRTDSRSSVGESAGHQSPIAVATGAGPSGRNRS
jgi:hypothetical protein